MLRLTLAKRQATWLEAGQALAGRGIVLFPFHLQKHKVNITVLPLGYISLITVSQGKIDGVTDLPILCLYE